MSNAIISELTKRYHETGLSIRESRLEALDTLKQIKEEIRSGGIAKEVLSGYDLGEKYIEDVL